MNKINKLVNRCCEEGLPDDRTAIAENTVLTGAANETSSSFPVVEELLWDTNRNSGLISTLKSTATATDASVIKAWRACDGVAESVLKLKGLCSRIASSPSGPEGLFAQNDKFVFPLKDVWDTFTKAHCHLKDARHGPEASTGTFMQLLSRRHDPSIDGFDSDVAALESAYNHRLHQMFLLENFYEALRVNNGKHFRAWGSEELASFSPFNVKHYRWKDKTKQCQPDYNSTKFYKDHDWAANKRLGDLARRMVLCVDGGQVKPTQESQQILQELEHDSFSVPSWSTVDHAPDVTFTGFIPFCRAWYQMQGTLNTLTAKNGLWNKDDENKRARAALLVREKLAISLDHLEDIEEAVKDLNENVLDPMLVRFEDVTSALQDLSANLLYGDDDDKRQSCNDLITSAEEWLSRLNGAKEFLDRDQWVSIDRDHTGFAVVNDRRVTAQAASSGLDWSQVVMGLDRIDLDNQRLYSLIARKDEHDRPTITTYGDQNSMPIGARACILELPKTHVSEFGRVNNWNKRKVGDYFEIPIYFTNRYNSEPQVVCWLEGFEIYQARNLRVTAEIHSITKTGCMLRIGSWMDTELNHMHVVWFAHSTDHPHIISGRGKQHKYGHHSDLWAPFVSVDFPEGKFPKRRPRVFTAISLLDMHHQFNPRCELKATNVTQLGMKVSMDAWWDTYCYAAEFTYLAFSEDFFQYALIG